MISAWHLSLLSMLAWGMSVTGVQASGDVRPRVVLRHGDPLPMIEGASIDRMEGLASINQAGTIVTAVVLSGEGVFGQNNQVLLGLREKAYSVLARESFQVPGQPELTYWQDGSGASFYDLVVAEDHTAGWRSSLSNDQLTYTYGYFSTDFSETTHIVHEGGPAPFGDGVVISNLNIPFRLISGQSALVRWGGDDGTSSLTSWGSVDGFREFVRVGSPAPGFEPEIRIESLVSRYFAMHADGRAVFEAHLTIAGGVTSANNKVIYQGGPDALTVLARTGDPAPDLSGSLITSFLSDGIRVNQRGDVALAVGLSASPTHPSGAAVLVYPSIGEPYVAVRSRQALPDIPGATVSSFHTYSLSRFKFDLNNAGKVAFTAQLSGVPSDANNALIIADRDGLRTVMQRRDLLPDGSRAPSLQHVPLIFNARDQFILPFYNLYATRPDGSIVRLAPGNGWLDTQDGERLWVLPSGGGSAWRWDVEARASGLGRPLVFNDSGQFVLSIDLQEGFGTSALLMYDIDDVCVADLAAPAGTLNYADAARYLELFNEQNTLADLAAPFGVLNFFDLAAFLEAYNAGCP